MKNITPVSRRQFIHQVVGGLTIAVTSFFILPSSLTYRRIWSFILSRPERVVSDSAFTAFLETQMHYYDEMIIKDITPTDGWLMNVQTGLLPDFAPYAQRNSGLYLPRG